jgi:hypothetical protein
VLLAKGVPLVVADFNPRWFSSRVDRQDGDHEWTQDDMPSDDDIATVNRDDDTEESLQKSMPWMWNR